MTFFQDIISRLKQANRRQWFIVVLMLLQTIVTYISNVALPKDNGEVSRLYTVIITPNSKAFIIWSAIFIGEWYQVIWRLLYNPQWSAIGQNFFGFSLWNLAQSLWALMFPFELIWPCFAMIFTAWFGLLAVELRGMDDVRKMFNEDRKYGSMGSENSTEEESCSCLDSLLPRYVRYYLVAVMPQALHLGWITAATGLNLIIGVTKENDTLAPQICATICVCCLISVTAWTRCVVAGDVAVALALIWALIWIENRHDMDPIRIGSNSTAMITPLPVRDAFTQVSQVLAGLIGSLTLAGWICRQIYSKFFLDRSADNSSSSNEQRNKKFVQELQTGRKQEGEGASSGDNSSDDQHQKPEVVTTNNNQTYNTNGEQQLPAPLAAKLL